MRISDWSSDVCSSDLACKAQKEYLLTRKQRLPRNLRSLQDRDSCLPRSGTAGDKLVTVGAKDSLLGFCKVHPSTPVSQRTDLHRLHPWRLAVEGEGHMGSYV